MIIKVKKKSGALEKFDSKKIERAIILAGDRIGVVVNNKDLKTIVDHVKSVINTDIVDVFDMHKIVCNAIKSVLPDVAASYQNYRDYKLTYAKDFEKLFQQTRDVLFLGDKENANFDSALISTKGSLIRGYTTSMLYKKFYLHKKELERTKRGDIYLHDARDMLMGGYNCSLFDIGNVLKGGFTMSNVKYREPSSVLSALCVIGDITLVSTAQQFGGFTLAEIDKVLVPYCKKTLDTARDEYDQFVGDNDNDKREAFAWKRLTRELTQGLQGFELKLNTVPCSRGDFAFTTLTFGSVEPETSDQDAKIQRYICEMILKTRKEGHNGIPVVFPKLVYLYSEQQHKNYDQQRLFEKAIECSSVTMYPDFLSIDSEYGSVSKLYKEHHVITSPMGCRAYLTPWADPETGKYVTIGRCNIGAVSLNTPLIWAVSEYEHPGNTEQAFFELLDDNMDVIRDFLKRRYDTIRHTLASTNPMCFCQGGLHNGYRKPTEEVGDLVNYMTASFGITALNELTILARGKTLREDNSEFANKVLDHINERIKKYKEQDHYLYALYGTPAESLCGTQAKQLKKYYLDTNQDDKAYKVPEYFTNSFHFNVSEEITPFEKQDGEFKAFHKVEGGHIQYCRIDDPTNLEGMKAVVRRAMKMGFYFGINFNAIFCNDCHSHSAGKGGNIFKCPVCGSNNVTTLSRVCGYLGYSNVNGSTRMNQAKMAEIADRVSM